MVVRDIIVIGGSAGSIEVLLQLLHDLPADLGASLFVVVHLPSDQESGLPNILSRAGVLKATQPKDGERILPNRVYVALPDRHLQLERDRIRVVFGPRENRARPAIDPLFRTAALNFGSRVVGVILSGRLDDGRNGLAQVKRFGGITIVQDPTDAAYSEMPRNALSATAADYCVPAGEIAGLLRILVKQPIQAGDKAVAERKIDQEFVGITCPECRGPIYISKSDAILLFRCLVGHTYSPETMRVEHHRHVEDALWSAVASLREHANLLKQMAEHLPGRGELLVNDAEIKERHARELESFVERFNRPSAPEPGVA